MATIDGAIAGRSDARVVIAGVETDVVEADAPDSTAGVAPEAVVGAAMPRLSIKALSSSISAFIAANSLATAGGIAGSCKLNESARLAGVVAAFAVFAGSAEAEDESISWFAETGLAATWLEAVVCIVAWATDFASAKRQKRNSAESRAVVFDNRILMFVVFMLVVFMLVMEHSFPQWNEAWQGLRRLGILRLHPWTGVNQFDQQGDKDRVMNS
jgi:hypothetical protein